jgi:hypothetical protein
MTFPPGILLLLCLKDKHLLKESSCIGQINFPSQSWPIGLALSWAQCGVSERQQLHNF